MSEGERERETLRLYYICPLKWLYITLVYIFTFFVLLSMLSYFSSSEHVLSEHPHLYVLK